MGSNTLTPEDCRVRRIPWKQTDLWSALSETIQDHAVVESGPITVLYRYPPGGSTSLPSVVQRDLPPDTRHRIQVGTIPTQARKIVTTYTDIEILPVEVAAWLRAHIIEQASPPEERRLKTSYDLGELGSTLGQIINEAEWEDNAIPAESPTFKLAEQFRVELQATYDELGVLPPSRVLPTATELLADPSIRKEVQGNLGSVILLGAEELIEVGRSYLSQLAEGIEVTLLHQNDNAVIRPFSETGPATSELPPAESFEREASKSSAPEALARVLRGESPSSTPKEGNTSVLTTDSKRAQFHSVKRLIRHYRQQGVSDDDITVFVGDSSDVEPAVDWLRKLGVTTTSTSVRQFKNEPAARELRLLAAVLKGDADMKTIASQLPEGVDPAKICTRTRAIEEHVNLTAALDYWVAETQFVPRVTGNFEPVLHQSHEEAAIAESFDNLEFARVGAHLIDRSGESVRGFEELLEYASESRSASRRPQASQRERSGISVEPMSSAKHQSSVVSIVIGLTEKGFHSSPSHSPIATQEERRSDAYPAVTNPSPAEVTETFGRRPPGPAHDAYYQARSNRLLSLVARNTQQDVILIGYEDDSDHPIAELDVLAEEYEFISRRSASRDDRETYATVLERVQSEAQEDGPGIDLQTLANLKQSVDSVTRSLPPRQEVILQASATSHLNLPET